MRRPLILISPCVITRELPPGIPELGIPDQGANEMFLAAILETGGIPLVMPITEDMDLLDHYLAMADGVALPGGHDVNPELWGVTGYDQPEKLCPARDAFEIELVRRAVAADLPLLAICRGMQLMNVALGGSLNMDVPSVSPREGTEIWEHMGGLGGPIHPVEVRPGTGLFAAVGNRERLQVNSAHHCCVERLGEGLVVTAEATDGIVEGIELPEARFMLGVQWHPEYTWKKLPGDRALWEAFVSAARS
ncbi:gamma-glutamyl-gamma-aminobutyrate hydrolase family protein [Collinsella sp. AGMB00827]|uniref:Gamma-glutamyl-gamma-aminobutyrate hydrolase family protein n=1 Tax=Collinsella ureilytica TaxID=2869515 RepID=A0ABS7MIF2_9ACTN|nr:gamma-glutamyl-gamma-aminobutyrate hydrolase family protein [Collinsella urealyticum]MBY4797144.1 gamma-glutamyl-gamma-aminobutyrate hydrolase family protein [Collinsella urealyticum]